MLKMSYKTFVWTNNPHTYREEYIREPKFSTSGGTASFTGMGGLQRVITGEGAFFGENAYSDFKRLAALFSDETPGNLEHPVWGIRYCYFTGLELIQEPREDHVSYRFTFTCAMNNGIIPV